jgi:hypothetical protein
MMEFLMVVLKFVHVCVCVCVCSCHFWALAFPAISFASAVIILHSACFVHFYFQSSW